MAVHGLVENVSSVSGPVDKLWRDFTQAQVFNYVGFISK